MTVDLTNQRGLNINGITVTRLLNYTTLEVLADALNTTHVFDEVLEGLKTAWCGR
jgi:hypothetical protein